MANGIELSPHERALERIRGTVSERERAGGLNLGTPQGPLTEEEPGILDRVSSGFRGVQDFAARLNQNLGGQATGPSERSRIRGREALKDFEGAFSTIASTAEVTRGLPDEQIDQAVNSISGILGEPAGKFLRAIIKRKIDLTSLDEFLDRDGSGLNRQVAEFLAGGDPKVAGDLLATFITDEKTLDRADPKIQEKFGPLAEDEFGNLVQTDPEAGETTIKVKAKDRPEFEGGLTESQKRTNADIEEARKTLKDLGLDPAEVTRRSRSETLGLPNPDFSPFITGLVNRALKRKFGDDAEQDALVREFVGSGEESEQSIPIPRSEDGTLDEEKLVVGQRYEVPLKNGDTVIATWKGETFEPEKEP